MDFPASQKESGMDTTVDPASGFTDDEKYNNFLMVFTTAKYLDDGGTITSDWMNTHSAFIIECRTWISDYSDINDDIVDPAFRKCCSETETLLRHLCQSIWTTKTFNVKVYHLFMRHMKQILETVYSDDILAEMLGGLSV